METVITIRDRTLPAVLRINIAEPTLSVALNRAFKNVLKDPQIFHKSPLIIYVSVGVDGEQPIDLYQRVAARIALDVAARTKQ